MWRLLLLSAFVFCCACRPLLDGGWSGTANCTNDAFPVDALFDETGPGDVTGTMFISGIFGGLTSKGTIENGKRKDDGSYAGDLQTDTDPTPEFDFAVAYKGSSVDDLKGPSHVLDNNGAVSDTCDLTLARVGIAD